YQADATGQAEIYVQPFPGPGARVRVSVDGGRMPVWAPNGRELFYVAGDTLVSAEVVPGGSFDIRARHSLFTAPIGDTFLASYDVSPDGSQFVFAVVPDTPPRLAVFTDALAEVRQ